MRVIDLSQPLHESMPVYPGTPAPDFSTVATVAANGYQVKKIAMNTHVGTHMDAPAHMLADGKTLDVLPLERFVGRAAVLDVRNCAGGVIGIGELQGQKELLAQVDFVLFWTGWSRYWGQEQYLQQYPRLTAAAAAWLGKCQLKGVGIDAISFDAIDSKDFAIHQLLLAQELVLIENLTRLEEVQSGADFFAMPLPLREADGSPVRAFASQADHADLL